MLEPIAKVMEYLSALFLSFAPPETYRIIRGRDEREHGRIDVSAPDMNAIKRESAEGSPMRCEKFYNADSIISQLPYRGKSCTSDLLSVFHNVL